jgi:hypothetical protein
MTISEQRRPLAPIQVLLKLSKSFLQCQQHSYLKYFQIRETRFRVPGVSSEGVLPSSKDPNFVVALNTESRVCLLIIFV